MTFAFCGVCKRRILGHFSMAHQCADMAQREVHQDVSLHVIPKQGVSARRRPRSHGSQAHAGQRNGKRDITAARGAAHEPMATVRNSTVHRATAHKLTSAMRCSLKGVRSAACNPGTVLRYLPEKQGMRPTVAGNLAALKPTQHVQLGQPRTEKHWRAWCAPQT